MLGAPEHWKENPLELVEFLEQRIRESQKRAIRVWRGQLALLLSIARDRLEGEGNEDQK